MQVLTGFFCVPTRKERTITGRSSHTIEVLIGNCCVTTGKERTIMERGSHMMKDDIFAVVPHACITNHDK